MAEGFRRAGIDFDLAVDKDPNAVESYEANLRHRPIHMDAHDLLRLVRLGFRPPVRLLVADPPCTPWSTAGKGLGLADERDSMRVTVELIRNLRPRAYLIGNVPGLETKPNIRVVQATIGSLASEGYCTADFAKLDAADYGVPQHRIRPFWFGHLEGPCLTWPSPSHGPPTRNLSLLGTELPPWVTCRDALGHLPADEIGRPVRLRRRGGSKRAGTKPRASAIDEPAHVITTRPQSGDGSILYDPKHPPSQLDAPARTICARDRVQAGTVLALPPNHPPSDAGHHDPRRSGSQFAPADCGPQAVVLSEKAAAILQDFPEDWRFVGKTKAARWAQIGQAMPPGLAEAVARSIAAWLEAGDQES